MCRLAAFPPGTSPDIAHEIVSSFAGGNEHGTGVAYLSGKSFVIQKYPTSYAECLTKKYKLFDHMPHKGWTIAHVRFATHGSHTYANTHPIIRGNAAVAHNGVFSLSVTVRAALNKSVKWQGETDTEVGAYMLNSLGPKEFYKAMPMGSGVWMALHRDGSLSVTKLSGDLEMLRDDKDHVIVASEFPWKGGMKKDSKSMSSGTAMLDPEGSPIDFKLPKKEERTYDYSSRNPAPYAPRDIGMMRPGTTDTGGSCGGPTSRIIQPNKQSELSFWDWPDDVRMEEYLRSLP